MKLCFVSVIHCKEHTCIDEFQINNNDIYNSKSALIEAAFVGFNFIRNVATSSSILINFRNFWKKILFQLCKIEFYR